MADVEISYNGSTIVSLNDSGTEVLETDGKFLNDVITVTYTKSGGGITPSGTKSISITSNGTTTEDVTNYASASIVTNVPNSYSSSDNGKVVSNGALVSQSSATYSTNNTYDTTLINSVTVSVPSASLGTKSITTNGTYNASSDSLDGYSQVTVNVSGGGSTAAEEKDVNFYDYDGTCLYSYTAAEFASLSALPSNPSHSGLTAQGWNWTLANAKTHVATYGWLHIGQMYVTSDGKTRIYINIPSDASADFRLFTVRYRQTIANDVVVDWGDGSTNTYSGTTAANHDHTYASGGHYMITLATTSGAIYLDTASGNAIYGSANSGTRYKASYIEKVEIGNVSLIGSYCFNQCRSCLSVTVPNIATAIGSAAFNGMAALPYVTLPPSTTTVPSFAYCGALRNVSIPKQATDMDAGAFQACGCLKRVHIPEGTTTIAQNTFNNNSALQTVTIPSTVTSIGASAFTNNFATMEYHFKPASPPTVANSNAFTGIIAKCKIYVPSGKLSAYTSANNYPSSSTYTYVEE